MANMNLIGVFVTKLCPVQALACGGGGDGGGDGGATKNIISPKFSNFGDIITGQRKLSLVLSDTHHVHYVAKKQAGSLFVPDETRTS